ncbi:MAG TPA: RNA polymerase sigma factor SigZ [Longimicrobium sp.]
MTATATIPTTEQAWTEFRDGLHGFLLRRVGDPDVADDLLQDVFLKVHTQLAELRDPGRLHPWMYRVARNAVADHFRARRAAAPLSEALPAPERERDAVAELAPCIRALVSRLPAPDREALELTDLGDLTQAELAHRLGISASGAKSRVQRARARLKEAVVACCKVYLDTAGGVSDYAPGPNCHCHREDGEAGRSCA